MNKGNQVTKIRIGMLAAGSILAACGGTETPKSGAQTLMTFEASFDGSSMKITPMETASGIQIPVDHNGNPTTATNPNTVDLVTTQESVLAGPCGGLNRYCANVVLRSYFASSTLDDPTVEILTINPPTGNEPINALGALRPIDTANGANLLPGLFNYPDIAPSGNNTRQWIFNNPAGFNFQATGRVYATVIAGNNDNRLDVIVLDRDNDWSGIMNRVQGNSDNGYRFRVGDDNIGGRGCRLEVIVAGVTTTLASRALSTTSNPTNCFYPAATNSTGINFFPAGYTMSLEANGNQIRALINGVQFNGVTSTDNSFGSGRVALYSWAMGNPPGASVDVQFDQVEVRRLSDNAVLFSDAFGDGNFTSPAWTQDDTCSRAAGGCNNGFAVPTSGQWLVSANAVRERSNAQNGAPFIGDGLHIGSGTTLISPAF